jgi:hypothetical protein
MSSSVCSREIVINIMCIEKGIVPFLGVEMKHVAATLRNMSDEERRITVRKFRKILKKAIRHEVASWHDVGSDHYYDRIEKLRSNTGLGGKYLGASSKKLSIRQQSLRHTLVSRYLSAIAMEAE